MLEQLFNGNCLEPGIDGSYPGYTGCDANVVATAVRDDVINEAIGDSCSRSSRMLLLDFDVISGPGGLLPSEFV
jgi:hypothetical protein